MAIKKAYKRHIEQLKERIVSYYGERLVSVVIFGSLARGTATQESDIDLLLIVEGLHKRKMKRMEEFIDNVEDKLGSKRVFKGNRWYWILKPDLKIGEVVEL